MKDWKFSVPTFLAVTMTIGFFTIVGILLFHEIPEGSQNIVAQLIGGIAGSVGAIVGYHYGSSSGSAAKSDTIAAMTGTGDGAKVTSATSTLKTEVTTVTPDPEKDKP